MKKPKDIDEYISGFPKDIQNILNHVRKTIKISVPDAEETISYGIPTLTLNKTYLIYFAGYKNHFSIYPVPSGNDTFQKEIYTHKSGKGTLQFPYDKPIPDKLIGKIVTFRIKENREKIKMKKK